MRVGRRVRSLFCFGFGYTAKAYARAGGFARIYGTARGEEGLRAGEAAGAEMLRFSGGVLHGAFPEGVTHILHSIPPGEEGDAVAALFRNNTITAPRLQSFFYLSTTGVYGDYGGGVVDESSPPRPVNARGGRRVAAENIWLDMYEKTGLPVSIYRLSGIYGPGRNVIADREKGKNRRIIREGQVFSRIHVEDIARILTAAEARAEPGDIYNCADDLPASSSDVIAYAAGLCGKPPPPPVRYDDPALSPMTRSFYQSCRRVSNAKIKEKLGVRLACPTYKEGLRLFL